MGIQRRELFGNLRYRLAAAASAAAIAAGAAVLWAVEADRDATVRRNVDRLEKRLADLESTIGAKNIDGNFAGIAARIEGIENRLADPERKSMAERESMAERAACHLRPCAMWRAHSRKRVSGFRFVVCNWLIPCFFTCRCAGDSPDAGNEEEYRQ